ncbi:chromosome segregation protein SMC [Verrucomicrobiota bacterium]
MYLKTLEIVGFKSFAGKTILKFEPGMTCIVGPNGCGKSNISDAVRWVLGEQRPKALRGSKMEDCIFNGTDERKPLGMAEVNITFADCEKSLGIEYNEVTISRRVFKSGEGQYFINKTPCRLKDVQRMFMDTGIGTTSYSVMEQGRIDQILSSRPEDRRTIFEEASGITKFKADKKETIRKLEHTEANLLRLADVIREVKRQIGSLQRQAGKARRFKTLRDELRQLDIHTTKERLKSLDREISELQSRISNLNDQLNTAKTETQDLEQGNLILRKSIQQTDSEKTSFLEKSFSARSKLEHTRELIRVNHQRIEEYGKLSQRDSMEAEKAHQQIESQKKSLTELVARLNKISPEKDEAEHELKICNDNLATHQQLLETTRNEIHELRADLVELESGHYKLQNQLAQVDLHERSDTIRKERLFAEQAQLQRVAKGYEKRQSEMHHELNDLKEQSKTYINQCNELKQQKSEKELETRILQENCAKLQSESAGKKAQIDILRDNETSGEQSRENTSLLLNEDNPLNINKDKLMGSLVSHIDVKPEYRTALDAVLFLWLDAVLVSDTVSAIEILRKLESNKKGSARLIAVNTSNEPGSLGKTETTGVRLSDHVKCPESIMPVIRRLLGNVFVADSLALVPDPLPAGKTYVTREGSIIRGDGCLEFRPTDAHANTPMARKYLLSDLEKESSSLENQIEDNENKLKVLLSKTSSLQNSLDKATSSLDEQKHALAVKEGETQIVSREADQAKDRLNTVTWELNNITKEDDSAEQKRTSITEEIEAAQSKREKTSKIIEEKTSAINELESKYSSLQSRVTEQSIKFTQLRHEAEHLENRRQSGEAHLKEFETLVQTRSQEIVSYRSSIEQFQESIKNAEEQLIELQKEIEVNTEKSESLDKNRKKQSEELEEMEKMLTSKRALADELKDKRAEDDLKLHENTMKRQNQLDRIASEYSTTLEKVMNEPDPDWKDGKPPMEALETNIEELRTKIEAMGPVNLVAIEEHEELEERHSFLTHQEADLIKAKEQLLEMIRKINRTTSEMFRITFAKVNENFQIMFKKLFNGGSAKLVLVNEEDVLECGIEIIARPPGKRLQNITLLSGGERTLTAVALLFAIYMIKPSPFCLLDELDAALDDTNIGRFATVLQEFVKQSQFVVITHNRQTIAAASILYGVTMHEKGISSIVSMKFKDHEEPEPVAAS